MWKDFFKSIFTYDKKQWYIRQENFINTGKSKLSFFSSLFTTGGVIFLVLDRVGIGSTNSFFIVLIGSLVYVLIARQLGLFWFRTGFEAEANSFRFNYERELKQIMENTKK